MNTPVKFLSCEITQVKSGHFTKENTGLGNVLFQIASIMSLSKRINRVFICPDIHLLWNKLESFGFNHKQTIYRNVPTYGFSNYESYPKVDVEITESLNDCQTFSKSIILECLQTASRYTHIRLSGYYQSHIYFDEFRKDIVDMFSPDKESLKYIHTKYPSLLTHTCISLHVRQKYGGNVFYKPNYFLTAIQEMRVLFPDSIIYIFSDDIEWCKLHITPENCIYVSNNPDYIDLWTMMLCKHHILSHSTLSWWGAYLNNNPNKIVIYPRDALRIWWGYVYNEPIRIERKDEHYFPNWKCIDEQSLA